MAEYIDYGRPGQWQERQAIQVRAREPSVETVPLTVGHFRELRSLADLMPTRPEGDRMRDILAAYAGTATGIYLDPLDYLQATARAA